MVAAHGNSIRALCKYLFKISNEDISNLEIPTGNPLVIDFDKSLKVIKARYLDEARAKQVLFSNLFFINFNMSYMFKFIFAFIAV